MAALRLHQVVALQKDAKSHGEGTLTVGYHTLKRREPMVGLLKTYEPVDADGEKLPSEGVRLQTRVEKILADMIGPIARQLDLTATVAAGNQIAVADVVVDGVTVISNAPVSFLMELEKKLVGANGIASVIADIPTLDPSIAWTWNESIEAYQSDPTQKTRSKEVSFPMEVAPATQHHKAQVEVLKESRVVGVYTTVLYSGAVDGKRKRELAERVRKLAAAVKIAREEANSVQVEDREVGAAIFKYLNWAPEATAAAQ